MKVALDLRCLTPEKITGIGVYASALATEFAALVPEKKIEIESWIPWRKRQGIQNLRDRSPLPVNVYNEWTRYWSPPDLLHGPDFKIARWGNFKKVVTIHDLVEFEVDLDKQTNSDFSSQNFMKEARAKMHKMLNTHRPDAIICISDFTRERLLHFFPDLKTPLYRIYHGVHTAKEPKNLTTDSSLRPMDKKYLLYVGTLEARKNPLALLESFEQLQMQKYPDLQLVFAGGLGLGKQKIIDRIKASPAYQSVHHLQGLQMEQLNRLYQHAEALVMPSLYEGFGLPIIEAMNFGTPVITSDFGAMKEVAGDAAQLVNSRNTGELAEGIDNVINPSRSQLKLDLIARGYKRAQQLTWRQTAIETMQCYQNCINDIRV